MRKIIVFCATLFVALSNSFAISGFTKGDEIPTPYDISYHAQNNRVSYVQ